MTSYSTFTKNAIGKEFCNPDGTWCGECVSFVRQYIEQVFDIKTTAIGNADDYYDSAFMNKYFDKVPSGKEQNGDILCWAAGKVAGEYGHIGIRYGKDKILSQNYNYKKYVAVDPFFPTDYQGALRIKQSAPTVISSSKGGTEVITTKDTSILRAVLKFIKGWNAKNVDAGKYDASEMAAWVGHDWTDYLNEGIKEGKTFQANVLKALDYYASKAAIDKQIASLQLSEQTLKSQVAQDAKTLQANADEIKSLDTQITELKTAQPASVDEQAVVQNWFVKLWNSLFKKG